MRLDVELVNRKLYTTRNKAVAAIAAGLVTVNDRVALRPAQNVGPADAIVAGALAYLSGRGSLKLAHALREFGVDPTGFTCLDVGASTGGFTEVLLSRGAARVIAVEVGSNQLVPELRDDPRVLSLENTDIRNVEPKDFQKFQYCRGAVPAPGRVQHVPTQEHLFESDTIDIIVVDVSFISLTDIADALVAWGAKQIITLIKPQFEVPTSVAKRAKGVIRDAVHHLGAIEKVTNAFAKLGYARNGLIESPVKGGSGNTEFLAIFEIIKPLEKVPDSV